MKKIKKVDYMLSSILRNARAMGLHAELCGDAVDIEVAAGPGWIQPAKIRVSATVGGCLTGHFTFAAAMTPEERKALAQFLNIIDGVSMREGHIVYKSEKVATKSAWEYLFANFSFCSLMVSLVLSRREGSRGH